MINSYAEPQIKLMCFQIKQQVPCKLCQNHHILSKLFVAAFSSDKRNTGNPVTAKMFFFINWFIHCKASQFSSQQVADVDLFILFSDMIKN